MTYTPEQLKDIEDRRTAFIEEYGKLREKYQVDFISFPQFVPTKDGNFGVTITPELCDLKYLGMKSPIVVEQ